MRLIVSIGKRAAATLAAVGMGCFVPAWALVTSGARLSGTISGSGASGVDSSFQGSFSCAGTPTCAGEMNFTENRPGCANPLQFSGAFLMTGLDLSKSGPIQGMAAAEHTDHETDTRPDGTCVVRPGTDRPTAVSFTGSWNAASGSGTFAATTSGQSSITASFRAESGASLPPGSDTLVTGAISGSPEPGSSIDFAFTCTGRPTCTGGFSLAETMDGCSNIQYLSGAFAMSGLELSQSGPLGGLIVVEGGDFFTERRPDGTCGVRPEAPAALAFAGNWNASAGRGSFSTTTPSGGSLTGSVKADIPQPPPVFPMTVTSNITPTTASASADIQYRPQDVGTTGSVYVFALAPATIVKGGGDAKAMRVGHAKGPAAKADAPVACVLAQLTQAGQMVAVTADQLQAYLTGVLSAQGASVSILNGVPIVNVAGSTFFVGYGTSGGAMIDGGVNRGAVSVPGSLACQPGPPQTGWWWNPLEDGRGFSLEVRGNNIFFAAFLYDISGRSTWYVSTGPVSLEGSYYAGDLLSARGGQTLGGAYPGFPALSSVGRVTLTFHNAASGTMVWPGGTVPIQRFNIVPNGLNLRPVAGEPESGWWWNEQEAGRGFFLEWQGGNLDIAGYLYDDAGNSVWHLTTGTLGGTATARSFSGNWWSFGGGQTLTGAWKPNTRLSDNVAPVTIQFSGPDTALMTLPNSRTTTLKRHRF